MTTESESSWKVAQRLGDDLEHRLMQIAKLRDLGARGENAAERLDDSLRESVLSADVEITIDVTLYTGGPAGGVEFKAERTKHGFEMISARTWHQEWFETRSYAVLDPARAEDLFQLWGLEFLELDS
jgi:hypothetical protein